MSWLELVAVLFGIVSVFLNARQNPLGWPTGLVNVALYTVIFFRGQLYALMALQVFFFVISLYGWYQWLRGGAQHTGVSVSRTPPPIALAVLIGSAIGTVALGWFLDHRTDDRQPYLDSAVSVISIAAQWMMARKYYETWWIWTAVNVVSVPFFIYRREYPTAVQYTVFLGLAISGVIQWRRSLVGSS